MYAFLGPRNFERLPGKTSKQRVRQHHPLFCVAKHNQHSHHRNRPFFVRASSAPSIGAGLFLQHKKNEEKRKRTVTTGATRKSEQRGIDHPNNAKTEFKIVPVDDVSNFPVGTGLVPLDTELQVYQEQKGFFPPLEHLIPKEDYIRITVTRDMDLADEWISKHEAEGKGMMGYMIHMRKSKRKIVRLAFDVDDEDEAFDDFEDEDDYDSEDDDDEEDDLLLAQNELADDYDDDYDDYDVLDEDEEEDDERDFEDELFGDGSKANPALESSFPVRGAQGQFRYYADEYFKDMEPKVVVEDDPPPGFYTPAKERPDDPPFVHTDDPDIAEMWRDDRDGPVLENKMPDYAVPVRLNTISTLSVCFGKHVLVVQLRRMRGVGPRLYDVLYDSELAKVAYKHVENVLILKPLGLTINGGNEINQLVLYSSERKSLNQLPYELRKMLPHHQARVYAGVDISDRDFYENDWNNPTLSERQVACLAKEAFSLWAIGKVMAGSERADFYDIGVFLNNPIPASYVEAAESLPDTVVKDMIWNRGVFYEDLGKYLPSMQFHVKVTVTRNPEVADEWCRRKIEVENITMMGYTQEWAPGHKVRVSAIFALATEDEVLICQQLYWTFLPESVHKAIQWKTIRKSGPQLHLEMLKKAQEPPKLRGTDFLFKFLLPLYKKRKKANLPQVIRDLTFIEFTDMVVNLEDVPKELSKSTRWDKPAFTDEEIKYQAVQAWLGWAVQSILKNGTPEHGERLKAYLLGNKYLPKKVKLPAPLRRKLEKVREREAAEQLQAEQAENNPVERVYQPLPAKLEELSQEFGDVTTEDMNELIDSLF